MSREVRMKRNCTIQTPVTTKIAITPEGMPDLFQSLLNHSVALFYLCLSTVLGLRNSWKSAPYSG